jgi:hypothetical protein
VWEAVFRWVIKSFPTGIDGWNHFSLFANMFMIKKDGQSNHFIWLAATWNI